MTTSSINHRPAPFIAAAAAVAAIAAGSMALSLAHHNTAPGQQPRTSVQVQQATPQTHHLHPTTSGGRVMIGA